jgi:flagellar hook-length control protein FliK
MLDTFRGTVESDPMRIPAPARSQRGNDGSFAAALEQVTPREPEPEPVAASPADIDDDLAPAVEAQVRETGAPAAGEQAAVEAAQPEVAAAAPGTGARSAAADINDIQSRGEPGRRMIAGKGNDSPRTSSLPPAGGDALARELAELQSRAVQLRGDAAVAPAATTAATNGKGAGEALLRGVEPAAARADGAAARAVKPGYRTSAAATAELVEQARDSVFKQILFRITGGGGEMRLRLEPPDLGELDLRLTVEGGNRVSLVIAAERGDLADMIGRHIAELAETLAEAGLELTHADVHARDADAGGADAGDAATGAEDEAAATNDITGPARGGYIRADGLDFWV